MNLLALLLLLATPPHALPDNVRSRLNNVVNSEQLSAGVAGAYALALGTRPAAAIAAQQFGLLPYEPEERPELFAHNADYPLTPASNLKLYTTAAAVDLLGPDYTWTTRVVAAKPATAGVVPGLWLVGGGDPALTFDGLRKLAAAVKAAGINRVAGAVVCDATRYRDKRPDGWTDDDTIWYYGAEVWGIALDRNQVDVVVRPGGTVGAPADVSFTPESSFVQVRNGVTTASAGSEPSLDWSRDEDTGELVVRGRVPNRTGGSWTQGLAVIDVPRYCASVFTVLLRQAGVKVEGSPGAGAAPAGATELAHLESPKLSEVMVRLLKRSDNLYAEMFNREVGVKSGGDGGAAAGVRGVMAFLARQRINTEPLHLVDGSGLSRNDRVTARATAGVLRAMALNPAREAWWHALPIAGVDGTLANRMKGTLAEGNVRAKTGYVSQRTGLSGYVTTRSGDLLIGSTIYNRYTCSTAEARALHDRFFVVLAEWAR